MQRKREVYLLDPQIHSPETIAVAFAKTSRSPESFRQIAGELTNEKSAQFNEKWVVGYGHSSVAEHAVLHIAVENISRLAVECLESNRLASYTEKSTRYQQWGGEDFYVPQEFPTRELKDMYLDACQHLFQLYEKSLPLVIAAVEKEYQSQSEESQASKERIIRTAAVDVCRFLLPVSAFANVGMTINARALEHAITKMLSHPLSEVRSIGMEIKSAAQSNIPTLLKYANEQPSLQKTARKFLNIDNFKLIEKSNSSTPGSSLIYFTPDIENQILSTAMAKYQNVTYAQALSFLENSPESIKSELLQSIFAGLDNHDIPIRELEYGNFIFEIILDQGAYLELKRHRMMTQTPLSFTPQFGYTVPKMIQKAGLLDEYCQSMELAKNAYDRLFLSSPAAASYVLPNAFNRCVILQTNFRTLYHMLTLRTASNAHFSMRRIGHQMAHQVKEALPCLGSFLKINPLESAQSITDSYFYKV
jgi:thymidylate synthase ThyX